MMHSVRYESIVNHCQGKYLFCCRHEGALLIYDARLCLPSMIARLCWICYNGSTTSRLPFCSNVTWERFYRHQNNNDLPGHLILYKKSVAWSCLTVRRYLYYYLIIWLAPWAGKMEPSCPLGTTRCIPKAKFHQKPYNKSFIDQVWGQDGWILASFFFLRVYGPRLRLGP